MKPKIERLVCSVFCFIETICTFIRYHYFYPQSLLIINNEFSVFRATPSLRLIFLARIVKSKHEIRGIHFNFCTISLLIHQFNILNRLHILTSVSQSGDISRNFLISIHFFVVVALAPIGQVFMYGDILYRHYLFHLKSHWNFTSEFTGRWL